MNESTSGTGISSYGGYLENPFKKQFVSHLDTVRKNKMRKIVTNNRNRIIDHEGTVISENQDFVIGVKKVVDSEQFTKFYHESLKLIGLNDRSMKVMFYIAGVLSVNQTEIDLHYDLVGIHVNMSKSSYYRALTDLLDHEVIARHKLYKHRYFINPIYMFNGDRIMIYNEIIREGSVFDNDADQFDLKQSNGNGVPDDPAKLRRDNSDLNAFNEEFD